MDLVTIDKSRFNDAIKAYFLWKELNALIKNNHSRGVNIPETITETLLCYVTGFKLNKGSGGDAFDETNNRIIEVKATSNFERDTSSFSPKEKFDDLHFVRLNQREDRMYFYDLEINDEILKKVKVNKMETLEMQQNAGRRPRFSIIKQIIEIDNIKEYSILDLREKKIIKK